MEEKKKKENGLRLTIRLYDQNDILRFKNWQRELKSLNKNISEEIVEIVMNYLREVDKKVIMRELKDDMFYAFRKALYASMYPYTNTLRKCIEKYEVETVLANQKMDVLLNILADNKIEFNERLLNRPSVKLLTESDYFQNARKLFEEKFNANLRKEEKKASEVAKTFQKYSEYEFGSKMDSNIEVDNE